MTKPKEPHSPEPDPDEREDAGAWLGRDELEDGSLEPDELDDEPAWWDEGSDE